MTQKFSNNGRALLAGNILAGDTALTVEAGKADSFPVANTTDHLTPNDWYKASLEDSSGNIEIVHVGTRASGSGVMSVILRGQDGTTAKAFTAGAVVETRLTSEDVEDAINAPAVFAPSMVPVGGIVMYDGLLASLPANWKVCDGTSGTPDMRDKFVPGAGGAYALGATGGNKDAVVVSHGHTNTVATESATHTHSATLGSAGDHTHNSVGGGGGTADATILSAATSTAFAVPWASGGGTPTLSTSLAGAHEHSLSLGTESATHNHTVTINSAGVSGTNANLPPYYALYYIKRIS